MQIAKFLTDLCYILAIFKYKIPGHLGNSMYIKNVLLHKRSFNWKEKVLSFFFFGNIEENLGTDHNQYVKNDSWFTWKRSDRFFSNFAYKLCSLSSSNILSFVMKCLTRFRDTRHYLKWGAVHYRCYGDSCC